jgi:hypothetical protein
MVSSVAHESAPKLDFDRLPMSRANFKGMAAYGHAKLCGQRSCNRATAVAR